MGSLASINLLPGMESCILELAYFMYLLNFQDHQMTWSCWDRIEVPGVDAKGKEITLRDLCDYLKVKTTKYKFSWVEASRNPEEPMLE